ncbi:hypothetical protein [Candidatus Pelagibacter sp.]|uniref:hypothetical protein n=1 Tax=Candidatus Pelagibacter sp. TaxID=2024849 RepID=UPI003F86473C
MRKQFVKTTEKIFKKNKKSILLLGDIGVFGFRNLLKYYPDRSKNIGVLEQSTISFAAGLALMGFTPIVHTIAPFLIARAFEQLKIDFGYQKLKGKFVTTGSSYDYSTMGCTHHCAEDINLMTSIPNMQIIIPGSSEEFNKIFTQTFKSKNPMYFRLSDYENKNSYKVKFGKLNLLRRGSKATIIAVGPVMNCLDDIFKFDVNIIYLSTIRPLDVVAIKKINKNIDKFLLIEPYFSSNLNNELNKIFRKKISIKNISIPYKFLTNYGNKKQHDNALGFTKKNIEKELLKLLRI